MKQLTVFTPTFNRGYCLGKCYESLKNQTNKNFFWLIIDDGSTDNTEELVKTWIKEKEIEIHYCWQENQGMHGAHNTAYDLIQTELNTCIDSDDYMPEDAVEKILNFWNEYGSDRVSGIIGLDLRSNGEVIGSLLPENIKSASLFNLYHRHGVKGDKKLVYRTELTKRYRYPIYEEERYVGLAYKYYKLDEEYDLLLLNEPLCIVEYLPDGSSVNMLRQYKRNPRGFAFYRKELMQLPFGNFLFKFRHAVHYVSSSLLMKNKNFISESPNKSITALAIPFGLILYLYIIRKTSVA